MDLDLPGSGKTISQTLSVFDYDTGKYKYYKVPMSAPPLTGHYRVPRGQTPETLAFSVPAGAEVVGEGSTPRGIIASFAPAQPVGEVNSTSSRAPLWALALGAAFVLYVARRKR